MAGVYKSFTNKFNRAFCTSTCPPVRQPSVAKEPESRAERLHHTLLLLTGILTTVATGKAMGLDGGTLSLERAQLIVVRLHLPGALRLLSPGQLQLSCVTAERLDSSGFPGDTRGAVPIGKQNCNRYEDGRDGRRVRLEAEDMDTQTHIACLI